MQRNRVFKPILSILRFGFQTFYRKPSSIIELLKNRKNWCIHESYFPDKKGKSSFAIFKDQLIQILKFGYPNEFYFPYGFDVKTKVQIDEYLHLAPFMRERDKQNIQSHSPTAVLRDKLLFGMFAEYYGIKTAKNLALSTADGLFDLLIKKYVSIETFFRNLKSTDIFLKPVDGECGKGIYHIIISDGKIFTNGHETSMFELNDILSNAGYLIQSTVVQHEGMKSLHPQSLNTVRLVTIINPKTGQPEVFPSILRVGTGDSIVDNTSQGGLAVGIHLESGKLKDYGFYKPTYGTKVQTHPDSGIKFSEFKIPYFEECKRQAIFLHSHLSGIHSIGWDIAVTPNGPIFIEGNDNWEINGPQICNGPLKDLFLSYCKKDN